MSNSNVQETTLSGGTLAFLLFLAFLVLKLTHVISWSWWWVTAPLWGGPAITAAVAVVGLVVVGLVLGLRKIFR